MPRVLSFSARGRFAAHRDPSVTTHQLVYYAPPKSAIVGMIGAILGTKRSDTGDPYSGDYIRLLANIRVGIGMLNEPGKRPQKVLFGTNRRPLTKKHAGQMKPTKSELVENPNYRIYVTCKDQSAQAVIDELKRRIDDHDPVYPIYFGHAYCQARIENARVENARSLGDDKPVMVETTILRAPRHGIEGHPHGVADTEEAKYRPVGSTVIVENKMIHNEHNFKIVKRSIPHMIPLQGAKVRVSTPASKWQKFLCWDADTKKGDAEVFSVF